MPRLKHIRAISFTPHIILHFLCLVSFYERHDQYNSLMGLILVSGPLDNICSKDIITFCSLSLLFNLLGLQRTGWGDPLTILFSLLSLKAMLFGLNTAWGKSTKDLFNMIARQQPFANFFLSLECSKCLTCLLK